MTDYSALVVQSIITGGAASVGQYLSAKYIIRHLEKLDHRESKRKAP